MNLLDIILIIWLALSFFSGWKAGFVYKLGNLIGTIIGFYLAIQWTPTVASWFGSGVVSSVVVFFILWSIIGNLFGLIAWIIDKFFKIATILPFVKTANRFFGAVLSIIISCVVIIGTLAVVDGVVDGGRIQQYIDNSFLVEFLILGTPVVMPLLREFISTITGTC